jgi:hypothetical protein
LFNFSSYIIFYETFFLKNQGHLGQTEEIFRINVEEQSTHKYYAEYKIELEQSGARTVKGEKSLNNFIIGLD